MSNIRKITRTVKGTLASDGAGVKLTRIIASTELDMLDPLLLLDRFESENPEDYIAGFPPHPHRGFETVTYMLAGKMRHKDNASNEGVIEAGGVQWMTAASGVTHSEMPEQKDGLMKGFQLWINLPASHKFGSPGYQEFAASSIPIEGTSNGGEIRVITGTTNKGTIGPVVNKVTEPIYLDVTLAEMDTFVQSVPESHNAVLYVIDGEVTDGEERVSETNLAVLGAGSLVEITTTSNDARFLLIAGKRLDEPVARGGPFVMNTKEEVLQAFADSRAGLF